MSKFKKGDTLQLLHLDMCEGEPTNWAKKAKLIKGEKYKVEDVNYDGSVRLEGFSFLHNPNRFILTKRDFHTFLTQKYPLYADGEMHVNLTVNQIVELVGSGRIKNNLTFKK